MPGPPGFLRGYRGLERPDTIFSEASAFLLVPAESGLHLFVFARCIIVRLYLQLLQGLQIELLITTLRLSGLFP